MDIAQLVLPGENVESSTAARGRARLKYLQDTHSVSSLDETRIFARDLGRDSLQLKRCVEVGYRAVRRTRHAHEESDCDDDVQLDERERIIAKSIDLDAKDSEAQMMDMDWDTSLWSLRQIEKGCDVLICECRRAERSPAGVRRRDFAQRMLARLIDRHLEARAYMERELENVVKHALPNPVYGLDDEALNLAPLLASLTTFAAPLVEMNTVRRLVHLLLIEPNLAARLIQTHVRLRFMLNPTKWKAMTATNGDMCWLEGHTRASMRLKWLARCLDLCSLLEQWRTSRWLRRGTPLDEDGVVPGCSRRAMLTAAFRSYVGLLETLCSKTHKLYDTARRQVVCTDGRGITALLCLATKTDDPQVRLAVLRLLLLLSPVPSTLKHMLTTHVVQFCAHALNDEPGIRYLALDVLQALALSTCTACRPSSAKRAHDTHETTSHRENETSASSSSRPALSADHVCALLVQPRWLGLVLSLLEERDERLFVGAIRFAQRCAATCASALSIVTRETLTHGGRPLERIVLDGIGAPLWRLGNPLMHPGFASLELLAQLTSDPVSRTLIENGGAPGMLEPLLSCRDANSPAFLRALAVCVLLSQSGTVDTVMPGSMNDVWSVDARQLEKRDEGKELSEIVRRCLMRILLRPSEDAVSSCAVLLRLNAAPALVEFLCCPRRPTHAYDLPQCALYVHCVALHRIFLHGRPTALPRTMLEHAGGDGLLRFAALGVQANFFVEADDASTGSAEAEVNIRIVSLEASLKLLSLAATVDIEQFYHQEYSRQWTRQDDRDRQSDVSRLEARLGALGERAVTLDGGRRNPRHAVVELLLTTSALGDLNAILSRAPSHRADAGEASVVAAAAGVLAAASPTPIHFSDRLWSMATEPGVTLAASCAAAEDLGLSAMRARATLALVANLSRDSPLETCAAACAALAKLGCTPQGAEALCLSGAVRAMAALAPRHPITQNDVDAVLAEEPVASLDDLSTPLVRDRIETCRFVRLPVAWFELAAAIAISPSGARQLLQTSIVRRCLDRFSAVTHKPRIDALVRVRVAALIAQIADKAARSQELKSHTGRIHEMALASRRLVPGLVAMLDDRYAAYEASHAIAVLCTVNVAAAVPIFVEAGAIDRLVDMLLSKQTNHPLLRNILVTLRACFRLPSHDKLPMIFKERSDDAVDSLKRIAVLGIPDRGEVDQQPIDHLARSILIALSCHKPSSEDAQTPDPQLVAKEKHDVGEPQVAKRTPLPAPAPRRSNQKTAYRSKMYHTVALSSRPDLAATRPPPRVKQAPALGPALPPPARRCQPKDPIPNPCSLLVDPVFSDPVARNQSGARLDRAKVAFDFSCFNGNVPAVTFENIHEIVSRRRIAHVAAAKSTRRFNNHRQRDAGCNGVDGMTPCKLPSECGALPPQEASMPPIPATATCNHSSYAEQCLVTAS